MRYYLEQRFFDAKPAIEALACRDPGFESLLADYEQLSTWLAVQDRSSKTDDEEIRNAVELIGELETEIRKQLEEYDEHAR